MGNWSAFFFFVAFVIVVSYTLLNLYIGAFTEHKQSLGAHTHPAPFKTAQPSQLMFPTLHAALLACTFPAQVLCSFSSAVSANSPRMAVPSSPTSSRSGLS
jgi:hypothetical protein